VSPLPADQTGRVFPVPLWATALALLAIEFALWTWLAIHFHFQHGHVASGFVVMIASPLGARLLVCLASYFVSRWKGSRVPVDMQLGPLAWLGFIAVEYFHLCIQNLLLIPFRGLFHTSSESGRVSGRGRVLLLQSGYVNNGAVWFFTARALEQEGFRVFTIDQPVFASIDTMGERLAQRVDEVLTLTGEHHLTLVAHSMGGLVCRAYLRQFGSAKVSQVVTLGSPHHGTFHAYLASGPNGLQMRPGNPWLMALAKVPVTIPFTSVFSVHDTVISPQESSRMPGAINVQISAVGHVSMPSGKATRRTLLSILESSQA
jgi:triacylglycerol lipase